MPGKAFVISLILAILTVSPLFAEDGTAQKEEGAIFTLWPLVDYRESPREGYSNLAVLGPLFKFQRQKDDRDIALRPLFYETANHKAKWSTTEYLYPLASSENSPEVSTVQVLYLYQNNTYRRNEEEKREKGTMLFPFYISGKSDKYGPYTSVFPFYGDMYERFWRDEYHYVMFPLYGRTVKKGTTNRNYLYPIFSFTSGERESGFQVWPLYGQAAKEGVYSKRFAVWPIYMREQSGLDTDNPTSTFYLLPLYAATDSPKSTSRYYLWPFFGHKTEADGKQEEWDYFWPFVRTIRGEKRTMDSYLPFYSRDERPASRKRWIMWPISKHEELNSAEFRQERDRLLYFLYSDNRESWPKDGASRRRTAFWPLFLYKRDPRGVKSLSVPAPVESVLDREGIERSWAPFWRLYQQKWDDNGDSAASFLWNLYWHERRGKDLAYEFFPLIAYRSETTTADVKLLKGLVRYRSDAGRKNLSFFWLPFGFYWGEPGHGSKVVTGMNAGSKP
ncbi:MAG TPA: hypothetical protein VI298_13445 [Geobacteraceae bacterium]